MCIGYSGFLNFADMGGLHKRYNCFTLSNYYPLKTALQFQIFTH